MQEPPNFNTYNKEIFMKKLFQLGAMCFGLLATQGYAEECCAQPDAGCPADQPCGDCYCLYCHYEPCYYNDWKCVDEPYTCKKQCCRQVPQYYEVEKCRYVPQYYKVTCCRYVPQYYCVEECKTRKKWCCEKKCRYVPRYYYKHICGNEANAVSGSGGCGPSGCGVEPSVSRYEGFSGNRFDGSYGNRGNAPAQWQNQEAAR